MDWFDRAGTPWGVPNWTRLTPPLAWQANVKSLSLRHLRCVCGYVCGIGADAIADRAETHPKPLPRVSETDTNENADPPDVTVQGVLFVTVRDWSALFVTVNDTPRGSRRFRSCLRSV